MIFLPIFAIAIILSFLILFFGPSYNPITYLYHIKISYHGIQSFVFGFKFTCTFIKFELNLGIFNPIV